MTLTLRIVLIVAALLAAAYTLRKIRKSKLSVDDAFFWITFSLVLIVVSVFPAIADFLSSLLGIQSSQNLVFLIILAVLLYKLFHLAIDISIQKRRLNSLIQRLAIMNKEQDSENAKVNPDIKNIVAELNSDSDSNT